jgi:hypothetical protein
MRPVHADAFERHPADLTDFRVSERLARNVENTWAQEVPPVNKYFLSIIGMAASVVIISGPASAHHGDADRYIQDVIVVNGTVVEVQMTNPHAHVVFDVTDANGKTVRWQAELGGPQQLIKNFGWTPSTVKQGTKITLTGRRLRSGAPYLNLTERANIVLTDSGKEIYRTQNYGEPPPKQ